MQTISSYSVYINLPHGRSKSIRYLNLLHDSIFATSADFIHLLRIITCTYIYTLLRNNDFLVLLLNFFAMDLEDGPTK